MLTQAACVKVSLTVDCQTFAKVITSPCLPTNLLFVEKSFGDNHLDELAGS